METARFKIIVIVMLVLALVGILYFVRRKELQLKYSLVWIIVDFLMILSVAIPGALDAFARLLGIYSKANMLYFMGFMFILAICFSLTVALSRSSERIRMLSQELGLYKHDNDKRKQSDNGSIENGD